MMNQESAPAEVQEKETPRATLSAMRPVFTAVVAVFCVAMSFILLANVLMGTGSTSSSSQSGASGVAIMDRFDMYVTNEISKALDGVVAVENVYWLSDSDLVAPEPDPANYGTANSPSELQWLLEEAAYLLDDQDTLFTLDTDAWAGDKIYYYYDDTILVITWKQVIDDSVYTFSEVKIAHASQFRRFLAGGEFGHAQQYVTTEMAESVNAVVASSGDFYKFRKYGIMVYGGEIMRMEGANVDTCMIDDNGDLHFIYRNDITDKAAAEQYVEDNNIRFSLAFGPILIDNGEVVAPSSYPQGEVNSRHSRAALCQLDSLHYLLVTSNGEKSYATWHTLQTFTKRLAEMGIRNAYALDGGQTAVIAMQGETINEVDFGFQRQISDIIYFATALPNGE